MFTEELKAMIVLCITDADPGEIAYLDRARATMAHGKTTGRWVILMA